MVDGVTDQVVHHLYSGRLRVLVDMQSAHCAAELVISERPAGASYGCGKRVRACSTRFYARGSILVPDRMVDY